jgi:hypothetical protein
VHFIGPTGDAPKLTARVGGFPEYNGLVLITKDGRLPWIPQTLDDKLTVLGAKRETALAEWTKSRANLRPMDQAAMQKSYEALKKSDPAGAEKFLETMKEQAREIERQQRDVTPMVNRGIRETGERLQTISRVVHGRAVEAAGDVGRSHRRPRRSSSTRGLPSCSG